MPIGKGAKKSYFKKVNEGRKIAAWLLDPPKKVTAVLTGGGGDSSLGNKNRPSYYGPRR